MSQAASLVPLLRKSRYFSELPDPILARIALVCTRETFDPGELIIRKGTPADAMYIIEAGTVDVLGEDRATGSERLLRRLGEGDCFGEIAFLIGKTRTAHIRGHDKGVLVKMNTGNFEALVTKVPSLALAMCKSLARWLDTVTSSSGSRFVKIEKFPWQAELVSKLSVKQIEYFRGILLARDGSRLVVGMIDPTDLVKVDELRKLYPKHAIETVAIAERELKHFIEKVLPGVLKKQKRAGKGSD